ncbi:hypothetical protein Ahy_A07g036345 [Arachis hypogaea]|uniref:Replication factor A C-terminal domain-containing protein n=1 Tax=Arachis hypogaea TaxID=3818 RepID=A0A445CFY5_ARAHY|nr:hypothetical protein Ahy_A07g036345 [Arachis hypogaea]
MLVVINFSFDHNMHVVSSYIVPLKSLLDKNNYNFNDINLPASEHIFPLCDVGPYVPSYNQPFFFPNPSPDIFMKSFLYPNNGNGLFMSSTVCKELPITVQSDMSDLDIAVANQVWRIKVRVIKIWSINLGKEKFRRPNLEMVVMDELGDRIQCSVRNPLRRLFEQELVEGNVYSVANFSIELNDQKYKPTNHTLRVFFKRESQIRVLVDINFPNNIFHFVPNEMILNHDNPQSHLIDVIGLLTGKGDIIKFSKNGKKSIYMVIELDDMQSKGKIRCTLWEEFATQLVKHMEQYPNTEFIIIVQFAKFNLFKGIHVTSLSFLLNEPWAYLIQTTTLPYTLALILKKFIMGNDKPSNQLSQIASDSLIFLEQDLINHTPYKFISELKESTEVGGIFVTIGTVISIDTRLGWWYKGCKMCFHSLKEDENSYYCHECDIYPNTHVPRFCIQMRVSDETDSASFIVYDKKASKFLEISASELRLRQISKGCGKDEFSVEINSFRGKKFLFKISVKLDDINAFQPCKITVLKLTEDPNLLTYFSSKYKTLMYANNYFSFYNLYFKLLLKIQNTPIENTELQSLQTDSTDNSKEISSQSCEIISLDDNDDFVTPKRGMIASVTAKNLLDIFPDNATTSSSKCRKLSKESDCSFVKEHYKDQLNQRMFFIDLNQNQVEVMIGKGHSCAYILAGFDTLVKFYELKEGGWMKVMFIGEDLFLITKVKDSAMISKTLPSSPVKFLLDIRDHNMVKKSSIYTGIKLLLSDNFYHKVMVLEDYRLTPKLARARRMSILRSKRLNHTLNVNDVLRYISNFLDTSPKDHSPQVVLPLKRTSSAVSNDSISCFISTEKGHSSCTGHQMFKVNFHDPVNLSSNISSSRDKKKVTLKGTCSSTKAIVNPSDNMLSAKATFFDPTSIRTPLLDVTNVGWNNSSRYKSCTLSNTNANLQKDKSHKPTYVDGADYLFCNNKIITSSSMNNNLERSNNELFTSSVHDHGQSSKNVNNVIHDSNVSDLYHHEDESATAYEIDSLVIDEEDLHLSDEHIMNLTLAKIEDKMQANGRSLKKFPAIPYPSLDLFHSLEDRLLLDEGY